MQNTMAPTDLLKTVRKVPILGHYGGLNGHLGHFGQINVHEIILFLHKKVHRGPRYIILHIPIMHFSRGPLLGHKGDRGPWPVLCQQVQIQQFIRSNGTTRGKTKFNLSCIVYRKYDFPYTTDAQTVDQVPTLAQRPTLTFFGVMISKITEPRYLCIRIN